MIDTTGSIDLTYSSGRPRIVRTPRAIGKVKTRVDISGRVSVRKLARELFVFRTSIHRSLKEDLKYRCYKKRVQLFLTDTHKAERKVLSNWIYTNFRKEKTMRILFSDEKIFDIDRAYSLQNERGWVPSRSEANERGGIAEKRKFPQKVMVWLGAHLKGTSPLVIFEEETSDHARYIKGVLSVALKYENKVFGSDWTFKQDGNTPHTHQLNEQRCQDHFPPFIDKDHWVPNSPDLNSLD